jgi:co-chaperonin GroES (HSP10)
MAKTNASEAMLKIAETPRKTVKDHLKAHLDVLGPYKDTVLHSQVLVMTYIAPSRTAGGIIITQKSQEEDRFQGKIGFVVAMGPGAFKDDAVAKFHGEKLKKHDWVLMRPADGMEIFYNGCSLRLFQDVDIKCRIEDPSKYW